MRALVQRGYGAPHKVLSVEAAPAPTVGAGEVLVRVAAASVNSWDWDKVVGRPFERMTAPLSPGRRVLGADIAGVVAEVGPGVAAFRAGDRVFGDLSEGKWGGFAELAAARATELAPIPDGLGFGDAAALPQAGALALQALRMRPGLGAGQRLLFNGAGGGVGTIAVQLAKRLGVHVTAVDSAAKLPMLRALGADETIDYREIDFTKAEDRYDMIINVVARRRMSRYARCLKEGGDLVVVGGTVPSILSAGLLGASVGKPKRQRMGLLFYRVSPNDNLELARMVASGSLRVVIDSVQPLARGADAIARLGSGDVLGKVLIEMPE